MPYQAYVCSTINEKTRSGATAALGLLPDRGPGPVASQGCGTFVGLGVVFERPLCSNGRCLRTAVVFERPLCSNGHCVRTVLSSAGRCVRTAVVFEWRCVRTVVRATFELLFDGERESGRVGSRVVHRPKCHTPGGDSESWLRYFAPKSVRRQRPAARQRPRVRPRPRSRPRPHQRSGPAGCGW